MKITAFNHVDNGKIMYAVSGETDDITAIQNVCRLQKKNMSNFMASHTVCDGMIYKNKLYIGTINRKSATPCKIVYRKNIDVSKYR